MAGQEGEWESRSQRSFNNRPGAGVPPQAPSRMHFSDKSFTVTTQSLGGAQIKFANQIVIYLIFFPLLLKQPPHPLTRTRSATLIVTLERRRGRKFESGTAGVDGGRWKIFFPPLI